MKILLGIPARRAPHAGASPDGARVEIQTEPGRA